MALSVRLTSFFLPLKIYLKADKIRARILEADTMNKHSIKHVMSRMVISSKEREKHAEGFRMGLW